MMESYQILSAQHSIDQVKANWNGKLLFASLYLS